jgi:probable rRNA maturation factor
VSKTLLVQNRQRTHRVDLRVLKQILQALLIDLLRADSFELGINIVGAREMTRLNETFLHHQGSTDVLAFDYTENQRQTTLRGEIFVCADEATIQAARFRTSWQNELVRYVVHGVLHLRGYDDKGSASRRKMKREEDRLLRELGGRFVFGALRPRGGAPVYPKA